MKGYQNFEKLFHCNQTSLQPCHQMLIICYDIYDVERYNKFDSASSICLPYTEICKIEDTWEMSKIFSYAIWKQIS